MKDTRKQQKTVIKWRYALKQGKCEKFSFTFDTLEYCKLAIRSALREEAFPDEAGVFPPSEEWYATIEKVTTTTEFIARIDHPDELNALPEYP